MLEFIKDHYLIIMIVLLFLIFALIGYIIDSIKNKKRNNQIQEADVEITEEIGEPEVALENNEEGPQVEEPTEEETVEDIKEKIPEVEETEPEIAEEENKDNN